MYGSSEARATALRQFSNGKLKMARTQGGAMLPRNTARLPNDNDAHAFNDADMFLAGGV